MGAAENVAIMQRAYDAFNSGDLDTLTEIFDESAVWHLPGRSAMANDYQGSEAILTYFGRLGQETGGTFQAELQTLLSDDARPRGRHPAQHRRARRQAPGCWQLHRLPARGRPDY